MRLRNVLTVQGLLCIFISGVLSFTFLSQKSFLLSKGLRAEEQHSAPGWKRIDIYVGPTQDERNNDPWESSSQVGQDTVVNAIFPEKGFFVDLAANDYKQISNSYSLEVFRGWSGICIEANPTYWEGHKKRKSPLVSAVVGGNQDEKIKFFGGNGAFGGIVKEYMDNADKANHASLSEHFIVTISEVFRRTNTPKEIQYFSLDVEGAESEIFFNIPFHSNSIYLFTIERPKQDILDRLSELGYAEVGILGWFGDTMFMLKETPDFANKMAAGQLAITQITKSLRQAAFVDNDGTMKVNHTGIAAGVRCPYSMIKKCGGTLLKWDTTYEKVKETLL